MNSKTARYAHLQFQAAVDKVQTVALKAFGEGKSQLMIERSIENEMQSGCKQEENRLSIARKTVFYRRWWEMVAVH